MAENNNSESYPSRTSSELLNLNIGRTSYFLIHPVPDNFISTDGPNPNTGLGLTPEGYALLLEKLNTIGFSAEDSSHQDHPLTYFMIQDDQKTTRGFLTIEADPSNNREMRYYFKLNYYPPYSLDQLGKLQGFLSLEFNPSQTGGRRRRRTQKTRKARKSNRKTRRRKAQRKH